MGHDRRRERRGRHPPLRTRRHAPERFRGGAKAQEEDLARASALYPCLRSASAFYAFHRDQRDVPALVERRAERVLRVAAAHGHRTLVLGAWGCGVFRNDPAVVASAFAGALRAVDQFERVIFAIRDDRSGTPVYRAFESAFAPSGSIIDD